MSFDQLPIEIIHSITGFLPSRYFSTVSRVSKICRAAAEPHLYRDLVFCVAHKRRVRWLLATLLHRPKLAAYIKSICVVGLRPPHMVMTATFPPRPSCDMGGYIEHAGTALDTAIQDICGSQPLLASQRNSWKGAVLNDDYFEGSLALIVCMAINVKSIALVPLFPKPEVGWVAPEVSTFMSMVLKTVTLASYVPGSQQIRSLGSLENLDIISTDGWHLNMLPSLKKLRINSPVAINPVVTNNNNLRDLHIVDITSSQFYFGRPVGGSIPPNLVRLLYRLKFDRLLADTYQQFVDNLITDCPQLKELDFGFTTSSVLPRDLLPRELHAHRIERPLRNMYRLSRLQKLRIDVDLLAYHTNIWDALLTDTCLLPPRLRSLDLTNVCDWCLKGFIYKLLPPNGSEALRDSAPILLVKEQSWAVCVESLPKGDCEELDEIAKRFEITMSVVCCIINEWSSRDRRALRPHPLHAYD